MEGKIFNTEKPIHIHVARVKPIEHHYENKGERPYIKYGCPVCESLGERFSFPKGIDNCPICNVNLLWH
ncbi:MAG: hypothetical protein UFG06_05155 [Lachnospiraceae bacterium]|nr:hypothetical protein [Lachnospiraceae bacterium]